MPLLDSQKRLSHGKTTALLKLEASAISGHGIRGKAVPFFNVITSPGLGKINAALQQEETFYGQAKLSINTNPLNGNLFIKEFAQTFVDQGFHFELSF